MRKSIIQYSRQLSLLVVTSIVLSAFPLQGKAQRYNQLWNDVDKAVKADKPKTEIECLQKIVAKAEKEKAYGHLMKAELMIIQAKNVISPDSLEPAFKRLLQKTEQQTKPIPKAVYHAILGKVIQSESDVSRLTPHSSSHYFDIALADPGLLSKTKASGYDPLVETGLNGDIYDHDLLSVIAHEAKRPEVMRDCYNKQPKRRKAAMMATIEALENDAIYYYYRSKTQNPYFSQIDSLIGIYGDIPECCEAAIVRYKMMDKTKDITDQEKYEFLKQAIARWDNYERCAFLKNEFEELVRPELKVVQGYEYVLPNRPKLVKLPVIKGVNHLKIEITKVNIGKETQYSLIEGTYKSMLAKYGVPGSHKVLIEKEYPAHEPYEVLSDSVWIEGMPAGVYFIDYITDNPRLETIHNYFHVTDIALLMQPLPGRDVRLAVVNSTTGQPMPDAHVDVKDTYASQNAEVLTGDCNQYGEYIAKKAESGKKFFAYTDTDWGYREQELKTRFGYDGGVSSKNFFNLFTDRSIYRPGQTVSVAAIAVNNSDGITTTVNSRKMVEFKLLNPRGKTIETKKVATDDYGTAHVDFRLAEKGMNGIYCIRAGDDRVSFRVEEYKRPTFFVEIDKPTTAYKNGDTLTVTGKAMGYNGVPVQGAKVAYKVERNRIYFFSRFRDYDNINNGTILQEETVTTGPDGTFKMRVPLTLPSYESYYYYRFNITAQVTDQGGETQHGECSLPLGSRPRMMFVDIPERIPRDSLKTITVSVVNALRQPVSEPVKYTIERKNDQKVSVSGVVDANKPIDIASLSPFRNGIPSGSYALTAVCGTDTLRQQFVVFDMKDTRPAIVTHDWFYVSDQEFPRDGRPVYVQVGSSDADIHILYTVTTGEKVIDMGRLNLNNEVKTFSFNYKEEYQEGISVAVCWVKDTVFYNHHTVISRPLPEKKLQMEWATFRDKLTPGQQETWTLRVRQADGKPAHAQVMATLYDKSLEQLRKHSWSFDHRLRQGKPSTRWSMGYIYDISDTERPKLEPIKVKGLQFDKFNQGIFNLRGVRVYYSLESRALGGAIPTGILREKPLSAVEEESSQAGQATGDMQVRENLNETAFFYPALTTDAKGQVALKFTLPEALTTWRFMGLAHDKELNTAFLEDEAIASKTVMVQPNIPRFVRQNDNASITSRVVNTSANTVTGTALLELVDPSTNQVVFSQRQPYTIVPNGSATVTHDITSLTQDGKSIMAIRPLICRVVAQGKGYSDGEQHYLPILPDMEQIVNTRAITQHHPGEVNVDLTSLFAGNRPTEGIPSTLTVEYAENPAWMMIQTLPALAADPADNAISLAATCYANSVAGWLLQSSPVIASTVKEWQKQGNEQKQSLVSELEKNKQLKSLLLDETPWALDAAGENDRIRQLSDYLDEDVLNEKLKTTAERLKKLQCPDGGFSWMAGMYSSLYTTTAVAHMLARQKALTGGNRQLDEIYHQAMGHLAEVAFKEVEYMKAYEKDKGVKCHPSEFLIDYLYILALTKTPASDLSAFVVERLKDITSDLTIYGKATASVVLATYGEREKAIEFLESMIEYSVFTEEMGRYFDTKKAYSSWFDYKIPTSVACIEAMKMVDAKANERYIEEMQRWLLQEKRTQAWDTPVNTVNAVHAFLKDNLQALNPTDKPAQITIDGKALEFSTPSAGIGYVNTSVDGNNKKTLHVKKSSEGTSWGAVYAQFFQPVGEIEAAQMDISVKREVVSINGKAVSPSSSPVNVSVGDRVTIRLSIVSDRDYDFVQIVDKRAACLEPVNQLSGYRNGCYVSPTDHSTNYFYDQLRKGKHQMETEYYVDRAGTYQSGSATLQCVYAPAFSARDKAIVFNVKE
ncbi:MAG: hypothetical protein J6Z18_05980 [Prevotella sp.]|nr:hypothetical protein [Prevotella sp.]